jgi:hypothetical protein
MATERRPRAAHRTFSGLIAAAALMIGLAACSSSSDGAFCEQYRTFNASVDQINTAVQNRDPEGAKTAVANARQELDKLPQSAKAQVGPQVQALKESLQSLQAAIEGAIKSGDPKNNLGGVSASITGVQVASSSLKSAATC